MALTPSKINKFMMLKLPAAWFTGVRVKEINNGFCVVTVKLKWLNQNPFKSMFWAVQGMAAEMSTGALVMREIQESGKRISKQSWNLFPKIKETQRFLKNEFIIKPSVYEIHPELSFMAMNGMKVIEASKKSDLGKKIRIKLIQNFFPSFRFELVRKRFKRNDVLDDDILDSISVLWSTLRIVDNIAQFVPKNPKKTNMRIYF